MTNPHDENFSRFENKHIGLLQDILQQLQQLNAKEGNIMATLEEARDHILTAIEAAKAAMLSAVADLQSGASAQAVADALEAAVQPLTDAAAALSAADPTP